MAITREHPHSCNMIYYKIYCYCTLPHSTSKMLKLTQFIQPWFYFQGQDHHDHHHSSGRGETSGMQCWNIGLFFFGASFYFFSYIFFCVFNVSVSYHIAAPGPSVELHPRKRKIKTPKDGHSRGDTSKNEVSQETSIAHTITHTNPYQMYIHIRKQVLYNYQLLQKGQIMYNKKNTRGMFLKVMLNFQYP